MNNTRYEANSYFWNEKRLYLKDIINELAMSSKRKNNRDM
jgi:hypothetical protein